MKEKVFFNNRGAALILAIFMLIVFGIMGVGILSMLNTSSISSSEDLISTQAFFLAESGAEIKIKEILDNDNSDKTYHFKNFDIITELTVLKNGLLNKSFYQVKSTASKDSVKRTLVVKFWKKD